MSAIGNVRRPPPTWQPHDPGMLYKRLALAALNGGTAKVVAQPVEEPERFPHWSMLKNNRVVFLINDRLYVRETVVTIPLPDPTHSHPPALGLVKRTWFDCGPAPIVCG